VLAATPAPAAERYFLVRMPDGSIATARIDVDSDRPMARIAGLPGEPVAEVKGWVPHTERVVAAPKRAPRGEPRVPERDAGPRNERGSRPQDKARSGKSAPRRADRTKRPSRRDSAGSRRRDTRFFDELPGPSRSADLAIGSYRMPTFLLPIYRAAGSRYGVSWSVLAAINEIETDYGRNVNVSSAGAVGWMQFMPATWGAYGVDANRDGRADPYSPVDAIFAAARYLQASGYSHDVRRAIFAYNHANWYVESVLLRARLIARIARGLGDSLSGLTEGRFPVAARATYEREGDEDLVELHARAGAPAVAVTDGVVRELGATPELGRYVVLEDENRNRYMYAGLAATARLYPWPRDPWVGLRTSGEGALVPRPRIFAHPYRENSRRAGGLEQIRDARALAKGYAVYTNPYLRGFGRDARGGSLKPLGVGSHVVEGTVLGRVGRPAPGRPAQVRFGIRPGGRDGRPIDPRPILEGWSLLESTALYRVPGAGGGRQGMLGQLMALPHELLERRILADARIAIYPCGRQDVRAGRIDRRVLVTLAYLADVGLRPTVTSLRCGHSYYTSSGNVSHHSSGAAVDIAMLNGVPVLGHQGRGGLTYRAVRRLMALDGQLRPAQIISLLDLGRNTFAMGDHDDHIHVGFGPPAGGGNVFVRQPAAGLGPGQWENLVERLRRIRNPRVGGRG
jgi:hypothetical protein